MQSRVFGYSVIHLQMPMQVFHKSRAAMPYQLLKNRQFP